MNNVLFLGQNRIAESCFEVLIHPKYSQEINVCGIVSQEKDYNRWKKNSNMKAFPVFISNTHKHEFEILEQIKRLSINLIISIQHPWILSKQILNSVKGFAFNLHNAKLPDYKGYNSISHAILNDERIYTTTIHWMIPRVDMGDIAYEKSINIEEDDTAISLYERSVEAATENFKTFIEDLSRNIEIPRRQVCGTGKFYLKDDILSLKKIECLEDFNEVDRKSRAFYFPPHEPAYFEIDRIRFYVTRKAD